MTTSAPPVTRLCTHTLTSLHYRDADLVEDLMGQKTFTEVMLMQILGRTPRPVDLRITDVVLIVLMEHGLTPSAIATRLIYMSAPENLQGAVSAGLLAVGSSFVGTMENCARLLDRINVVVLPRANPDGAAASRFVAFSEATGKGAVETSDCVHFLLSWSESSAAAQAGHPRPLTPGPPPGTRRSPIALPACHSRTCVLPPRPAVA